MRLRIPKSEDDFGEVMKEKENLGSAELYDGKEIYVQMVRPENQFEFMPAAGAATKEAYFILFREWNPETWAFGPVIEVKMDKQCYSNKLA